jgi:hypothetical protein
VNVKIKEQSKQWMHTHSPKKPKKFKQTSSRKLMVAVFWDGKGVLMVEIMQQVATITSEIYCESLKKLCRAIQNKRRGMLTSAVVLLHDCASAYSCFHSSVCWSISAGSCLTTLLIALISLQAATTCVPT